MQAPRDSNNVTTILGLSNADGLTPITIGGVPTSHALCVSDGAGGADHGGTDAKRDQNRVTTWIAVSNADGVTPVDVYVDPVTLELLIQQT